MITIVVPISRVDYLARFFVRLEMLDCDSEKTNLLCYVDGPLELYQKVRNYIVNSKFKNKLCVYRRKGIASRLLDILETEAFNISSVVGIGVGLYPDYGSAQRLYVNRNYIPDGRGITYNCKTVLPGEQVILDDELVLWYTKEVSH